MQYLVSLTTGFNDAVVSLSLSLSHTHTQTHTHTHTCQGRRLGQITNILSPSRIRMFGQSYADEDVYSVLDPQTKKKTTVGWNQNTPNTRLYVRPCVCVCVYVTRNDARFFRLSSPRTPDKLPRWRLGYAYPCEDQNRTTEREPGKTMRCCAFGFIVVKQAT